MKEAFVSSGPKVEIRDVDIPKAGPSQVVIKVVFSGSNPKDWKVPMWMPDKVVDQGDDIAGTIHEVGKDVTEFKVGDRVAAFHEMLSPGGSYAEYALAHAQSTFHIPASTSYEEAASIPLAAMTAACGLYQQQNLGLPEPWAPATQNVPLLVWGGGTAVGSFAVQLALRSNIHPLIVVAGKAQDHVKKMIDPSKGDVVLDYRQGEEAVIKGAKDALKGAELKHVYDAVSDHDSYVIAGKILGKGGKMTTVLPGKKYEGIPDHVSLCTTSVGSVHKEPKDKDFGYVFFRLFGRGLQEGWFKGHPTETIPGGLAGVEKGLTNLKEGKASAVKYVFKIADTPGVGK